MSIALLGRRVSVRGKSMKKRLSTRRQRRLHVIIKYRYKISLVYFSMLQRDKQYVRKSMFLVSQENGWQKGRVHSGAGENASGMRAARRQRRNADVSQLGRDLQREQRLQVRKRCIAFAFSKICMFLHKLSAFARVRTSRQITHKH